MHDGKMSPIMNDKPITIGRDQIILDAIKVISERNVGALPIVEPEHEEARRESTVRSLAGIITLRDIVTIIGAFAPLGVSVKDYMTRDVLTVEENDTVQSAVRLMSGKRVRRLPVINSKRRERVDGMVTNKMMLRVFESKVAFNHFGAAVDTANKKPVRAIMMSPMPLIYPNEDCGTAAYLMRELGTGAFAVADSHGLLGIITERDLIRRVYGRGGISFFSELFLSKVQTM